MTELRSILFPPRFLIRINIEALRIPWVPHMRNNRSSIFAIIDIFPIDAIEEWMVFYALRTTLYVSQTFRAVDCAKRAYYIFGCIRDLGFGREGYGFGDDSGSVSDR